MVGFQENMADGKGLILLCSYIGRIVTVMIVGITVNLAIAVLNIKVQVDI